MPAGLQCFDGNGVLKLNLGDRIGRFTGAVVTNGVNGSYQIPGTNTGDPFFILVPLHRPPFPVGYPDVTLSGNTLSWTYPTGVGQGGQFYPMNCIIRFGVR